MALLAENVPEDRRVGAVLVILQADFLVALDDEVLQRACLCDAGQIALDVGGENGNTGLREAFRQNLQRHRLARSSGARDQPVAVGQLEVEVLGLDAGTKIDFAVLQQRPAHRYHLFDVRSHCGLRHML